MKLANIEKKEEGFTDSEIDAIVYEGIEDDKKTAKYAIVFGNSKLVKQRASKAAELYKSKRIQKIIFTGGTGGVSNQNGELISEALKMKNIALELGVREEDILLDDKSNNTFENVDNAIAIIGDDIYKIDNIVVITSEFHLKRCYGIIKKKIPGLNISMVAAKDGNSDRENWYLSNKDWDTGRSLASYEADLLIKYATSGLIEDLDINLEGKKERRL